MPSCCKGKSGTVKGRQALRLGSVNCTSEFIYEETHRVVSVAWRASSATFFTCTQHAKRKTTTLMDVVCVSNARVTSLTVSAAKMSRSQ